MAKRGSSDYINHYNGVRIRVEGAGNLILELSSLSDVKSQILTPIDMFVSTDRQEYKLANLRSEKAKLTFEVNEIYEYFLIGRISIYSKPVAASLPQR